jgi:3-oxoadipate enol-lactonase
MQRQYLHVGGRTIAYLDSAPGDTAAHALALIHAFPLGAAMWEGQVKALPPGWRLLAPDLRGYGGSTIPDPDDSASIDDYAIDVVDLLRELDIGSAVIGGLSMGGYVVFAVVRREPALARALILADTRTSADTTEGRANRRNMLALLDREGPSGVARDMMPKLLGKTSLEARDEVEALVRRLIKQQSPAAIRGSIVRMMERPDSSNVLQKLTIPTLIIVGEEDVLTPPEDARKMYEMCANAELTVITRAGHLASLEQPDAFNDAVRAFLGRL